VLRLSLLQRACLPILSPLFPYTTLFRSDLAILPRKQGDVQMNRKGFTLIELLIVVVIIGILAAIAIPKFANTKEKAYLASMKSSLKEHVSELQSYFAHVCRFLLSISSTR